MDDSEFEAEFNMYVEVSEWLEDEAQKITEEWYNHEKFFSKLSAAGLKPSNEALDKLGDLTTRMEHLENRMLYEDKIFNELMRKLDDM
jgi:hypothetical protein